MRAVLCSDWLPAFLPTRCAAGVRRPRRTRPPATWTLWCASAWSGSTRRRRPTGGRPRATCMHVQCHAMPCARYCSSWPAAPRFKAPQVCVLACAPAPPSPPLPPAASCARRRAWRPPTGSCATAFRRRTLRCAHARPLPAPPPPCCACAHARMCTRGLLGCVRRCFRGGWRRSPPPHMLLLLRLLLYTVVACPGLMKGTTLC